MLVSSWSDLKRIKPSARHAKAIQVIVSVPPYLLDSVSREQSCVRSNWIAAVEVKYLQSTGSSKRQPITLWRCHHLGMDKKIFGQYKDRAMDKKKVVTTVLVTCKLDIRFGITFRHG